VTPNVVIKCVAFSVNILEIYGSNLVWESGYLDRFLAVSLTPSMRLTEKIPEIRA
jgi:hypothetical protein